MKNHGTATATLFTVWVLVVVVVIAPNSNSQNPVKVKNGIPPGWSDDIDLSNSPMGDSKCSIAVSGNNIHVVWRLTYISATDYQVVYKKSSDSGKTWSPFVNISKSDLMGDDSDISAFENNVHVVWENFSTDGINKIYYRNSNDDGQNWNPEKRISAPTGYDALGPNIFINDSNAHIIWLDLRNGDQEMYYRRSVDGGITFDNGQGVDEDRRLTFVPVDVSYVRLAGDKSNISVLWCDESAGGDWDVYWMISKDNGNTWENGLGAQNVGRMLTDDTTDSTDPSVAVSGSNIHVIWVDTQWPGPVYKLYYRNSTDNGLTWNPIQLLTGPVPGIGSPDIGVYGDEVHVVWDDKRDDGTHEEIYYKNSMDGGITWSGDTRLTYNISGTSYWPRIAINSSTIHVTWYDNRDGNSEIYYKRSPDFPDTSPPSRSNETPLPDSYRDSPGTNVSVCVTDPSGVNASSIQLYVNGSLVTYNLTPIAGGYNVSYISSGFSPGVISCRIVANDNCSNHLDYTWNFTVLHSFKIPVVAGWNLISMPLVPASSSLPHVLLDKDGDTLWDRMQYYDPIDAANPWKQYNTGWVSSLNDLTTTNHTIGVWINVTVVGDGFLNVTGLGANSTTIPLYTGWNMVGYPTLCTNMTVADALWGTGATMMEVFDPNATYRTRVVGPTYMMKPGEGYWVYVPSASTWTVNW